MKSLLLLFGLLPFINGDLYLQSIRGSNNRLDEANRDRNNGDRLFNSQNNNRGGYNVGRLTFYSGEKVPISWTNQHSAGTYQLRHSEIIIQYMCDELMRDGTTTQQIPKKNEECFNFDCDTDVEYGRHESYWWYHQCYAHERNKGLFTANQNLNNDDGAIYTRQNPNGNRRGYECDEERDYYPYWRPSPWRDIAIYTNQQDRCDAYKKESQNVKAKYECRYSDEYWKEVKGEYADKDGELPMNQTECAKEPQEEYKNKTYIKWYLHKEKSHGISAPECLASKTTRANHHGTHGGRELWTYYWTVPDLSNDDYYNTRDYSQCCVVRVRYNITTNDYQAWESDESINAGLDYKNNTKDDNSPNPDNDPAWVKIWENFGLDYWDVYQSFDGNRNGDPQKKSRGYVFINNPRVDPFGHLFNYTDGASRIQVELAINTNQFGRTFEDRTHCFTIKDELALTKGKNVHLLTVQGKRGNIVQTYPATEYFFIPEPLTIQINDYVHFCWTGSNTNPNNNDGQGKAGTDRSNICPLTEAQYDKSEYSDIDGNEAYREAGAVGDLGNNYPNYVDEPSYYDEIPDPAELWYPHYRSYVSGRDMAGLDQDILNDLCTTRRGDPSDLFDYGNMEELDDAGTTFCIKPQRVTKNGRWNFLCTRNNNFSNRSQKGTLVVGYQASSMEITVGAAGGKFSSGSGGAILNVNANMVEDGSSLDISVVTWSPPGEDSSIVEITGTSGAEFSSDSLVEGGWMELWIPYSPASLSYPEAYRKSDDESKWKSKGEATIETKFDTSYAVINIKSGGFYKVENTASVGYVIAGVVAVSGVIGVMAAIAIKKIKN